MTDETKEIQGVTNVVVQDAVMEGGEVVEHTLDWYAQDLQGNAWNMGDIAKNFEDGERMDVAGSWQAGGDGARTGILMKAAPTMAW